MRRVGFTGSRVGMSVKQTIALRAVLSSTDEFHHGDCLGADAEAHRIAREAGVRAIVVHPPSDPKARAFCAGDVQRAPVPYLIRNRSIVNETEFLIAAPRGPEVLRSGTWATVRYARKVGKEVHVLKR